MRQGRLDQLLPGHFGVAIGRVLADQLGLVPGDRLSLLAPQATVTPAGIVPRVRQFVVIGLFESSIHAVATLAVFMPIVASMGGIGTTQTATVVVRGLAVGELTHGVLRRVLMKELWLGVTTGAANGLVIAVIAYLWKGQWLLSAILGIAMITTMSPINRRRGPASVTI